MGLFDDFADDEDAACEEAELFVFGGILVEVRLVVVEEDGTFVDGFVRHFDGDGVDLVGIGSAAEAERGEAMVGAVWVELSGFKWLAAVDGDFHDTALRTDDVIRGGVHAFVFEGDFRAAVEREEIVRAVEERTCDRIVVRVFPPWACDVDSGMVERNRDDFFPTVGDHWFGKIGVGDFLTSGLDGRKGAFDGFKIEDVTCVFIRMDAVAGERDFPVGIDEIIRAKVELLSGNSRHAFVGGFHYQFACTFEFNDFLAHVDGRDGVVVGDFLHDGGGALHTARLQLRDVESGDGIDEKDVAVWQVMPDVADDAFHGTADGNRRRTRIVDGEFHED